MSRNDEARLREALEHISTPQLDAMLHKELDSEDPDSRNVRLILKVLHDREKEAATPPGPEAEAAWAAYLMATGSRKREAPGVGTILLRVASVAVILAVLLMFLPQESSAKNIFEWLFQWTDSILELMDGDGSGGGDNEYRFTTDHPGLQQVYDTVTELGITQPVVPMWLPEGFELTECKVMQTPAKTTVAATFMHGSDEICFRINAYTDSVSSSYHKNKDVSKEIEIHGITHALTKNNDKWTVVWVQENIECSIFADCQEDALLAILKSIYTMEVA